jgi:tetratricopeptide (TPR) repeat protein
MIISQVQAALSEMEQGQPEKGLAKLKKLLSEKGMTDDLRYEVAQTLHGLGYLQEAATIYHQLLERYPKEDQLKVVLAEALCDSGQEEEALDLLRQVAAESEHYLAAVLLASDILMRQGLPEVAQYKIRQALKRFPEEKLLYQALGEIYFDQQEYSLALINFNKAGYTSSKKLAECYARIGQFEEALVQYQHALREEKDPDLLFGAGFVSFQLEEWNKAIEYFEELLDMDPYYTSAYPYLGRAYWQVNKANRALETVEKGLRYDETNATLFYLRGCLLQGLKEWKEAKLSFKQAVDLDPDLSEAWEALYKMSRDHDEAQEALPYLNALLELAPNRVDLWLEQGSLYEELERWKEAEQSYRQAIHLQPEHVEALNRLAFLLHAKGQREEAKRLWQRSLELNPDQWEIEEQLLREEP